MVVFSKVTTVALGLASVASALPHAQPRKGFTVNQLTRQTANPKTLNLPAQYAKFLAKYGATVPQSLKDAASKGTAVTKPEEYDSEYLTPVDVGGTTLNLDFDTGSADLYVQVNFNSY